MCRFIKYVVVITIIYTSTKAQESNPLNEKHLNVITMEFPVSLILIRNSTGHVISFNGVLSHHLAALSKMFDFSYSYLPTLVVTVEDILSTKGGISYLTSGEADFFLSTALATPSRFKYVDFPASWFSGPFGLIVPYPKETLDLTALLKPFSYEVWIIILIATLVIMLYLRIPWIKWLQKDKSISNHIKINNRPTRRIVNFVLGNLVSQGQGFYSNRLAYRIVAGAWCVGCFFLIQIFCSTLTSHLTSPNQMPIVSSLEELAKTSDVDFAIDKGHGIDVLLSGIQTGIFKNLADKFKKDTKLRCNFTASCLERVKNGRAAYSAPVNNLKEIVGTDLRNTGTCNYYMMKDLFLSSPVFNILPKNSPFTNTFSKGILRFQQFGFYDIWTSWHLPKPRKCMELKRKKGIPRLSTAHLSSPFLILICGYIFSIVIFILEKIFYHFQFLTKG